MRSFVGANHSSRGASRKNNVHVSTARTRTPKMIAFAPQRFAMISDAAVNATSPLALIPAIVRKRSARMMTRSGM